MKTFCPQACSRIAFACYRQILRLYPAQYRERYRGELVQIYRDMSRDGQADRSLSALARLWAQVLPDLSLSIFQEHLAAGGEKAHQLAGAYASIRGVAGGASPYRLAFTTLALNTGLCFALLVLITGGLCYWFGGFFLQKAVNSLFAVGETFALIGLSVWLPRAWKFQRQTGGFRIAVGATPNDTEYLTRSQRCWVLLVYENRAALVITLAGLLAILIAVIYWEALTPVFSPATVLHFLAPSGLPDYYFEHIP